MRILLIPALALTACAASTRVATAPTPLPAPSVAATPAATGWIHPERRGSIIEATPPPAGVFFQGVALVDTASNRVFVTGSDGALDAIELSTGTRVFHQADARGAIRRLGGGAVAAIDAQWRLVLLDAADGSVLFTSAPAGADPAYVTAVAVGKERLRVSWTRHLESHGGAYQPPSTLDGAFTVGLRAGEVTQEPTSTNMNAGPIRVERDRDFGGIVLALEFAGAAETGQFTRTSFRVLVARRGGTEVWRHPVPPVVQDFAPYP